MRRPRDDGARDDPGGDGVARGGDPRRGGAGPDGRGGVPLPRREFLGIAALGAGLAPLGLARLPIGRPASARTGRPRAAAGALVGSAPGASPDRGFEAFAAAVGAAARAGVGTLCVPVATVESYAGAARNLMRLHAFVDRAPDRARLVRSPEDLVDGAGRPEGRVGIVPTFQGLQMVVEELPRIAEFAAAGVGVMALTHNWKNWNGDGCLERSDLTLTGLGELAVQAMNEAGVAVDLSRLGRRGSLRAMEVSRHPVLFTNSNAAAVHDHPRNLTDEQIDACAATGGVVGLTAFPAFVSTGRPRRDDLLRHLDHVAGRVGIDHVGLGLGFTDRSEGRYPEDPIPEPPYRYPAGLESLADVGALPDALGRAGLDAGETEKVLGGNFRRVLSRVWSDASRG